MKKKEKENYINKIETAFFTSLMPVRFTLAITAVLHNKTDDFTSS